jgi:hypothetical protein
VIVDTATLLKAVFDSEIKDKFTVPDAEKDEIINQQRPAVQLITSTGMYGLTLNADNKIEHFDIVYVAEASDVYTASA